jgi:hypothetical protein
MGGKVFRIGGRDSHWPVAVGVNPLRIRLADSGRLRVLRRSQCTVGKAATRYAIPPSHVFIIERREGCWEASWGAGLDGRTRMRLTFRSTPSYLPRQLTSADGEFGPQAGILLAPISAVHST